MFKYLYWGSTVKHNGWTTNCEIKATSMIYGLCINVWLHRDNAYPILTTFGSQSCCHVINLLLRNNHFLLLHPLPYFLFKDSDCSVLETRKNVHSLLLRKHIISSPPYSMTIRMWSNAVWVKILILTMFYVNLTMASKMFTCLKASYWTGGTRWVPLISIMLYLLLMIL